MHPVLDLPSVLERLDHDRALLGELAQIFLQGVRPQLAAIGAAVELRDAKALRERAHSLGGSAANLAAVAVCETAGHLEKMALAGDLSRSEEAYATLKAEIERLTPVLEGLAAPEA